jgi:hypothetical protein
LEFENKILNGTPEDVEEQQKRVVEETQRWYWEVQEKIESQFGAPGRWFNLFTNVVLVAGVASVASVEAKKRYR